VSLGNPTIFERPLSRFGPYKAVEWTAFKDQTARSAAILAAAREHAPTLLFAQVQSGGVWTPELVAEIRKVAPRCLLVNWTGDIADHGGDLGIALTAPRWMRELAGYFDVVTANNLDYALTAGGSAAAGYIRCGYDPECFKPRPPQGLSDDNGVVFAGNHYAHLSAELDRAALFAEIGRKLPGVLHCYGASWKGLAATLPGVVAHPWTEQPELAPILSGARGVIYVSFTRKPARYTSMRLETTVGAGALTLVWAFEDSAGVGLRDGVNCFMWNTPSGLIALIKLCLANDFSAIRQAGAKLALEHWTMDAMIEQLAAIVQAERARRAGR
jgi:hypothetical protein